MGVFLKQICGFGEDIVGRWVLSTMVAAAKGHKHYLNNHLNIFWAQKLPLWLEKLRLYDYDYMFESSWL
jgi:hypothetical protein